MFEKSRSQVRPVFPAFLALTQGDLLDTCMRDESIDTSQKTGRANHIFSMSFSRRTLIPVLFLSPSIFSVFF
jgi:hypothetical protein